MPRESSTTCETRSAPPTEPSPTGWLNHATVPRRPSLSVATIVGAGAVGPASRSLVSVPFARRMRVRTSLPLAFARCWIQATIASPRELRATAAAG